MSIKSGVIIGYSYKVYYGSTMLHDSLDHDEYYDTEEEAREEARDYIKYKRNDWENDGAWTEDDSEDDFDIVIEDIIDDEEEE